LIARSPWGHFFVLLPDVALKDAIEFAERVRLRLDHYRTDATISVGVVQTGPGDLLEPAELVDAAFELAYEAESLAGGNLACSTY
jgi:PleD family two-component response regulator